MNKIILIGRMVKEPIEKETAKTPVINFTLACDDSMSFDKSYFFDCVAFGNHVKFISQYVHKGDLVSVDGRLIKRFYVNKENKTIYVTEAVVDNINLLQKHGSAASAPKDDVHQAPANVAYNSPKQEFNAKDLEKEDDSA
jgi:single-strand DNA-binding protein